MNHLDKILSIVKEMKGLKSLEPNEPILSSGLLDSFDVLILIEKLETNFNTSINLENMNQSDFDTCSNISKVIEKKLKAHEISFKYRSCFIGSSRDESAYTL